MSLFVLILASASAFAWPSCSGQWVSVPQGTSTANGVLYSTGDLLFQCQKAPSSDPKPTNNVATSTANSNSGASSTATGGSATATGGSSKSTSGVSNSGNSSNNNTNTAQGGAGGNASQTQSSTSEAANNGNNSNNYSNVENYKVASAAAYAPTGLSTAPCLASFSGGAQAIPGGVSFGGSRVDKGCDSRQTAVLLLAMRNPSAAAKVLCSTKAAKRAKLTLDECLAFVVPAPEKAIVVAPPVVPQAPVETKTVVEVVYVPMPHEVVNVVATKEQVKNATVKKSVHKSKPCIVPPSLQQPMEK